ALGRGADVAEVAVFDADLLDRDLERAFREPRLARQRPRADVGEDLDAGLPERGEDGGLRGLLVADGEYRAGHRLTNPRHAELVSAAIAPQARSAPGRHHLAAGSLSIESSVHRAEWALKQVQGDEVS